MIYLHRHSSPARRKSRFAIGIAVSLILIVGLTSWRAPQFFPGLMTAIARPFWRVEFAIESGALRRPSQLLAENEALKRELESLKASISSTTIELVIRENAELRDLLGRASTTPRVLAAVLARPPRAPYDELIIDLGWKDGVSSSTMVYATDGTLIGRISGTLSETAMVRLFSSPGSSYDVTIGDAHVPATAMGRGGGYYVAELPHGATVQAGDTVSDATIGDSLFGNVISVTSEPSSPFDQVLIAPPVNIFSLRWVMLDIAP